MAATSGGGGPDVTVVVPTFQRANLLGRLVGALEAQTLPTDRFEVVVVDDASTDDTPAVLATLAADSPLRITVVRQPVNGGPAAARNAGIAHARAEVIAFTDDDCVPEPGWLVSGLEALGGGTAAAVGRTVSALDQSEGPFSRTLRVEDDRFMQTCNVFYRRDVLRAAGGFDGALRTGEDTDLGLRVREQGHTVTFAPEALVVHDVRPSSLSAALRDAARWVDLPAVVGRHPQVRRTHLTWRVFWKPTHPPAILAAVGLLVAAAPGPARRRRALAGAVALLPWLRRRWVLQPLARGRAARAATLPGALAVDLTEVATMVRGSARHRSLVL